ncbi:cysteine hydrolase family protein [Campylobacter majalis]|uniref:cysteine hydrolase family protein n=1 Tax=Campylobacter majalis TaxID=2790656 RepID=UPI003D696D02
MSDYNLWQDKLMPMSLSDLDPKSTAIISVDMINGFCRHGRLSSINYDKIGIKVARLFRIAKLLDFKHLLLVQDRHDENSTEFMTFGVHCLVDSDEAQTIDEIKNLPFYSEMKVFYKNSLSIGYNDEFIKFLKDNPSIDTFIVVGVCTDLCIYNMISYLALSANEKNIKRHIIVPHELVGTYDAPLHDASFYQNFFLHHASVAFGAEICSKIIE